MSIIFATAARGIPPDPCEFAPTVSTCSVVFTSAGSCPGTPATWTVSCTLSGSLGSTWELKYWICVSDTGGCTPANNFATQTGLSAVFSDSNYEGNAGSGATTYYANAKVEVVPVGESEVCDSLAASQASRNPYRGCFD